MWPTRQHRPSQLGAIVLGGTLLYICTLLVGCLLSTVPFAAHFGLHNSYLLRLAGVLLLLPGVVIALRALSLLREGVRLDRWSDAELEALRSKANLPIWTAISWASFAGLTATLVFLPAHSIFSSGWLFLWLPMDIISSVRVALKKPVSATHGRVDWSDIKPLRSEHWGSSDHA